MVRMHYDIALLAFNAAIGSNESKSEEAITWTNLGDIYMGTRRFKEATDAYEASIQAGNKDSSLFAKKASALQCDGKHTSAIDAYKIAVSKDPNNVELRMGFGDAYMAVRSYEDAIRMYRKAKGLNKAVAGPLFFEKLGKAQFYNGNVKKAISTFEKGLKLTSPPLPSLVLCINDARLHQTRTASSKTPRKPGALKTWLPSRGNRKGQPLSSQQSVSLSIPSNEEVVRRINRLTPLPRSFTF